MVGISFKISKSGTRYVPKGFSNVKLQKLEATVEGNGAYVNGTNHREGGPKLKRSLSAGFEGVNSPPAKKSRGEIVQRNTPEGLQARYIDSLGRNIPKDAEASFAINLFPDGFSIDKPTEKGKLPPPAFEVTELHLLPYDRNTGDFLRAIDGGWIPSTLLDDIPCKYIDGCVVCELRDYRDGPQSSGETLQSLAQNGREANWVPTVHRVVLQRNSGNIFKDLKSMDFDGWTFQECVELEARLINSVQPSLCLDPTPDVSKEAFITNYNKLKYNIWSPIYGRYRKSSGSLRERKLHIAAAAAKALSRVDGSAKRRKSSIDGGLVEGPPVNEYGLAVSPGGKHRLQDDSKFSQATPGMYLPQPSASQGSLGHQTSMARAGLAHSISTLSAPSGPLSPATSAGGHEVTSGLGGVASMLGRRESKETAAAARVEAKQMKTKQAIHDKQLLQQRKAQEKQDAKEQKERQRKEKLQQQQQLKLEKQQLSRSNSHLSSLSQHSGSLSMGDGSTTPRSENRSSMVDQREGVDLIKMETHEVARPKQEFDTQSLEEIEKGKQEQQLAEARKQHGPHLDHMGTVQQPLPMNLLLPQTSLPISGVNFSSGLGVSDIRMGPNHNLVPPVGGLAQAQAHALASNLVPAGGTSHMSQMQARLRQNSLPKVATNAPLNSGMNGHPMALGSGALPTPGVKIEPTTVGQRVAPIGGAEDQDQSKEMESMFKLVAAIQRHGLHHRKKPAENVVLPNKTPPSFQLLSVALSETDSEIKEPMGYRSMANSLVGGNINCRKTRSLLFVKTEPKPDQAYQGAMNFHRSRKRLVLCGRAKDSLVEAIIQVGDDQEEEAVPPHHVLPPMANVHVADRFVKQYCALLKKENYELISDDVQQSAPRNPVVNAASSARPMPAGASTLGNPQVGHLATAQRAVMNTQLMQGAIPGNIMSTHNSMQPSSPSQLAANRMPPPSNAPSRQQMMNNHMGQQAVPSNVKPTQIDTTQASQMAAQQQQHHQLQQQAQMQRQPQQQQHQQQQHQHQQQMVAASQLAQLTGQGHNSAAPHLVAQPSQLQQLQYMQQQQQQQQRHHLLNQRKVLLPGTMGNTLTGMNNMNSVGMPPNAGNQPSLANMVNLGGMNNVPMGGMNCMASMSGMSSLSSLGNMGQLGAMSAIGQQGNLLRSGPGSGPGAMNQAAALQQASKVQQIAAGRGRTGTGVLPNAGGVRTQVDPLSALGGTNQAHGGPGVSGMVQGMNRSNNLSTLQRAPVTGLASSKVPSANQNYYLNSSQLSAQQQQQLKSHQLNSQQLNPQLQQQQQLLNSQQQQQQLLNPQQQQQQQQLLNPQQQLLNPQQQQQQQQQQLLTSQQLNSQQLNTQQQINPQQQLSGGGSLNSLVGNPASPQLSSGQSLGAVGSIGVSSSSVELQNASRAAAAAVRAPVLPSRAPTMPRQVQPPQAGQPPQSQ